LNQIWHLNKFPAVLHTCERNSALNTSERIYYVPLGPISIYTNARLSKVALDITGKELKFTFFLGHCPSTVAELSEFRRKKKLFLLWDSPTLA
jgi:hypothetical protein